MAKCDRLPRLERKVQLLLALAQRFLSQWIRGKEPVSARVPVSRIPRVLCVIEYRQRYRFISHLAGEHRPFAPRTPHIIALLSFAAGVEAAHAGVVENGNPGRFSGRVGKDFGSRRGLLELPRDAHSENPFLVIAEEHLRTEGRESRDPIDRALIRSAVKDKRRLFAQDGCSVG